MQPLAVFVLGALIVCASVLSACQSGPRAGAPSADTPPSDRERWAIAIHGGAGTIERDAPPEQIAAYRASLERALSEGRRRLDAGESALDTCEAVVRILEDDPLFNAGKGAAFNERAEHELDASIMDGSTLRCGAVGGVRTVKNPISLARLVMERTRHVLLVGPGAEEFADACADVPARIERVPNSYFDTPDRRKLLDDVLKERRESHGRTGSAATDTPAAAHHANAPRMGTVGCVALDRQGRLAAATSTGGLTGKRFGRVGDSPIIGAGTYADDLCAVSCTGTGEEFIRHAVAHSVSDRIRFAGMSVEAAANDLVFHVLKPDDGGLIAMDARGRAAMVHSTSGMYRGVADASGRFQVLIFDK